MPSSFIDLERGKGLCCSPGLLLLPPLRPPGGRGAVCPARANLAAQPLRQGQGWHVPLHSTGLAGG